jgi:hypothetical protein
MKRVLVSMLVLSVVEGLVATPAVGTEAGIWYPLNVNAASDNVLLTASAVTVFEIQDAAGPTYIVCLESAAQPSDKPAERVTYTSITSLLPEPATIALLGFSGFLMRRRKMTSR